MQSFTINFTGYHGWNGRKIISRDRSWLEFKPKGSEAPNQNGNPFVGVTKLDPNDEDTRVKLTAKLVSHGREAVNLNEYDVYSVYQTTCG